MLSRVAESLFWLGRNVERSETVARILDVNHNRAMDYYSTQDERADRLWRVVMHCAGFVPNAELPEGPLAANDVLEYCAFDTKNPSSIRSSIRVARSNALAIRSELTVEVWETINVLFLFVEGQTVEAVIRDGPSRFLRHVRDTAQAFAGVSSGTLSHGDRWHFLIAGRFLERAYMTSRMIAAIDPQHEPWPELQRLLEMCCASEPFAQFSSHDPAIADVIQFLVLAADFPRSLRFCVRGVDDALHRISETPCGTFSNDAEQDLGRMRALFDFTPASEVLEDGIASFAEGIVKRLERLTSAVERAYFPRLPVTP
jgi:uncharacterized alpha-E superfamily protein